MIKKSNLYVDVCGYQKDKALGYQEYLFGLLDELYLNSDKLTFSNVIIICSKGSEHVFECFGNKFKVLVLPVKGKILVLLAQQLFPLYLKLQRNDVILGTGNYTSILSRSKVILVVHDLIHTRKDLLKNRLLLLKKRLLIPLSIFRSDRIIAISSFTKSEIHKYYRIRNKCEIYVVYNYIDFDKFEEWEEEESYSEKYFLTVSSGLPHKNNLTVLKAFANYAQVNEDIYLYVVGEIKDKKVSEFLSTLKNAVISRIKFFKKISYRDLGKLYAQSKAFILASEYEGLGMPVVEAMYHNTTCLLSDIDIFREITEDRALFFSPKSSIELTIKLYEVEEKKFNNRNFIENKFSSSNTSSKYINILNNLNSEKF